MNDLRVALWMLFFAFLVSAAIILTGGLAGIPVLVDAGGWLAGGVFAIVVLILIGLSL